MLDRRTLLKTSALLPAAAAAPALAQKLPPLIRLIVVVPPGASMDVTARIVADHLRDALQRTVLVDYKVGGTGLIATQFMKTTEPDGAHIMYAPMAVASFFPFLYRRLPFDADRDLAPVCEGVQTSLAIAASLKSDVRTLEEFLAAAKADPLKASVGTSSMSGLGAFMILRLRQIAGVNLELVPYKGGQPLLNDLLGGQVPAGVSVISDYLAQHQAGKLRILATSGTGRSPLTSGLPTIAEAGYPELSGNSSNGFFVRGGTSPALIERYARELTAILRKPEVRTRLTDLGVEPVGGKPEDFQRQIVSERAKWAPVAKANDILIE